MSRFFAESPDPLNLEWWRRKKEFYEVSPMSGKVLCFTCRAPITQDDLVVMAATFRLNPRTPMPGWPGLIPDDDEPLQEGELNWPISPYCRPCVTKYLGKTSDEIEEGEEEESP